MVLFPFDEEHSGVAVAAAIRFLVRELHRGEPLDSPRIKRDQPALCGECPRVWEPAVALESLWHVARHGDDAERQRSTFWMSIEDGPSISLVFLPSRHVHRY